MSIIQLPIKRVSSAAAINQLTGDVLSGPGTGSQAASIPNAIVIGKKITGFVSGAGTLLDTDTILKAVNKLDGNDVALAATVTTGAILARPITGYVSGAGVIADTDTLLVALNKLNGNITSIGGKYVRQTRFVSTSANTGTISIPANATIVLDDFGGTVDAIVSGITGGRPNYTQPVDGTATVVTTSFDASGNYTLSGTPTVVPIAIIYRAHTNLSLLNNAAADVIGDMY